MFETDTNNGLKLGRLNITSLEPIGNAGKDGHVAPGDKSQQNQKQPFCFENLISTQTNHKAKCRATIA